jgi:hypothetical protein
MAREYGSAASHPTKVRDRLLAACVAVFALTEAGLGFVMGLAIGSGKWWASWIALVPIILIGWLAMRWLKRNFPRFWAHAEGARGEERVARILRDLPDTFHVFHGLETPIGDIDHLVIGPTGVFCLDAKKWNGDVDPDGRGELLYNKQPTDKKHIRNTVARTLALREMLGYPGRDGPFFRAALVFVEASLRWEPGSTGSVDCLRVERLRDHITRRQGRTLMSDEEIRTIAAAAETQLRA